MIIFGNVFLQTETLANALFARVLVAFPPGFEPGAFRLGGGRSILLSYGNMMDLVCLSDPKYEHSWFS